MKSLDEELNDVFRKLYPGWEEGRLMRDPDTLTPIAPRDPAVADHPALRITNAKQERIDTIRRLAAQGLDRRTVAEELNLRYSYLCQIAREAGIQFASTTWGQYTRGRK